MTIHELWNSIWDSSLSSLFIMKSLLKFEAVDYLIHYVKFEMWTALLYVNYLSYFQQWNLDSDITFPNSFIDSKSEFFEFDIWLYFQVFPNSQRNFGIFLMLFYLDFSNFLNSWKSFYEYNSNLHFYGKACVFFPINQVQMREKFQNFPGVTTSPNPPTVFGTNWTSLLTPSFAGFLSNMQYFPIIGQCRFF